MYMESRRFDLVFVGGGLSALMLLHTLGDDAPPRVAVIDDGSHKGTVHWSYWSDKPSYYDRFALGEWQSAHIGNQPPQSIAPLTLRVVRSADVLDTLRESLPHVTFVHGRATAIAHDNGTYTVSTAQGTYIADWVLDSATRLPPVFPDGQPRAILSGTGIMISTDRPVFNPDLATLFDPLPSGGFAYLLPLSRTEALVESAYFLARPQPADYQELIIYLEQRFGGIGITVKHQEHGVIPLGFAPAETSGPRHILLGTKRGLVKPSAGYGILAIERESHTLANLWRRGKPLPAVRHYRQPWQLMDRTFLQLVTGDPATAQALMRTSMEQLSLAEALRFLDGHISPLSLARLMKATFPIVSPYVSERISSEIVKHTGKH